VETGTDSRNAGRAERARVCVHVSIEKESGDWAKVAYMRLCRLSGCSGGMELSGAGGQRLSPKALP
jgi:hypothetical protein